MARATLKGSRSEKRSLPEADDRLIKGLGGSKEVSRKLQSRGVTVTDDRVRMWVFRGNIPWRYRPHLVQIAKGCGVSDLVRKGFLFER